MLDITIKIKAEDLNDVKAHLSVIRNNVQAMVFGKIPEYTHEGVGSQHTIKIEYNGEG